MLHTLSITQALDIWCDLELCLAGTHSYGGTVGEFYIYRLMPSSPTVERLKGRERRGSIFEKDINQAYLDANLALKALLTMFEERREAKVTIEVGYEKWVSLQEWDPHQLAFEHRAHIEISAAKKDGSARRTPE